MTNIWPRALAVWLLIILAESMHGTLRVVFVEPVLGSLSARQIAMPVGAAIIFAVTFLTIRWIGARSVPHLLAIGLVWVALTVAFEIGLGRLEGFGWDRITEDYDPRRGGFMILGLVFMALTPWIAARLRGVSSAS
jgi:hypothetical protein